MQNNTFPGVCAPVCFTYLFCLALLCSGCKQDDVSAPTLTQALIGDIELPLGGETVPDIPVDRSITLNFSRAIDQATAAGAISISSVDGQPVALSLGFLPKGNSVILYPEGLLLNNTTYTINISGQLQATDGARVTPVQLRFKTALSDLQITVMEVAGKTVNPTGTLTGIPLDLDMKITFSVAVNEATLQNAVSLSGSNPATSLRLTLSENKKSLSIRSTTPLKYLTRYELRLSESLEGAQGERFAGSARTFYTAIDPTPKFPLISEAALLDLVQRRTFRYFWDFAHPASGMARERSTSGDLVTSGGSGFGLMALIVGMERRFITRAEGLQRVARILDFLEKTPRFHGAWAHWMNGNTAAVIPFSANDNGADLVETSLLMQGLITFRQYLRASDAPEKALIDRINALWKSVEWSWFRRDGQNVLYWHWSPDKGWAMNLPVRGWNESLITYVLAASSPSYPIPPAVYTEGWARAGAMRNGATFEGVTLPLGPDYGGPLFFSHYSFLGLNPHELRDPYADYWVQNVSHTRINYNYCVRNPRGYVGYGPECWGLTASDSHNGYAAHSPANDLGVISPTAALSAFPYSPDESMKALKFFYYTMGDRLWGDYGFYDAFNITEGWVADTYLAIDQGPLLLMIENYRTGLLWNLFMSAPEIQDGLRRLDFSFRQPVQANP